MAKFFTLMLAKKEIIGNKRHFTSLFLIIFFVAALFEAGIIISNSLIFTIEEQRFNSYGAFSLFYTQEGESYFPKELCDSVGVIKIPGESGGKMLGFFDNEANQLGRLPLINGKLPEKKGEIAVESSFLLSLGYSYDLGQQIVLPYKPYLTGEEQEDLTEQEPTKLTFTLCGVLDNYTSVWGFGPSVIFSDKDDLNGEIRNISLINTKLSKEDIEKQGFLIPLKENTGAYPPNSLNNLTTVILYIIIIIGFICIGLLLCLMIFSLKKRQERFKFLRGAGATKGTIQGIILWQGLLIAGIAIPMGVFAGFCLGSAVMAALRMSLVVKAEYIYLAFILSIASAFIGTLIPSFLARSIKVIQKPKKINMSREAKRSHNINSVSSVGLMRSRIKSQKGLVVGILTMLFSCGFVVALFLNLWTEYSQEIIKLKNLSVNSDMLIDNTGGLYGDYIQSLTGEEEKNLPITKEIIKDIDSINGVGTCFTYKISSMANTVNYVCANLEGAVDNGVVGMFTMDLSPYSKSDYYREIADDMKNRGAQTLCYQRRYMESSMDFDMVGSEYGNFLSYSLPMTDYNNSQDLSYKEFKDNPSYFPLTLISAKQFKVDKGSCIVVLPRIYTRARGVSDKIKIPLLSNIEGAGLENYNTGYDKKLISVLFGGEEQAKIQGYSMISESEIKIGERLKVSFREETRELSVSEVINSLPNELSYFPLASLAPYTLIVDESFFAHFTTYQYKERYDCITIKAIKNENINSIDGQLSSIVAGLKSYEYIYTNLARERESVILEAMVNLGMFVLFLVLFIVGILVILSRIFTFALTGSTQKIAILRGIGMEKKLILKSYFFESLFYSCGGFGSGILTMVIIWSTQQIIDYGGKAPLISLIFSDGFLRFPWLVFLCFFIIIIIAVILLHYLPIKHFTNKNIAEQFKEGGLS